MTFSIINFILVLDRQNSEGYIMKDSSFVFQFGGFYFEGLNLPAEVTHGYHAFSRELNFRFTLHL